MRRRPLADSVREVVVCDDKCGCTIPCSGGTSCRCSSRTNETSSGLDHSTCSCGEHCGCNPCSCPKVITAETGCKCAGGCTCTSCRT